MSKEAKRQELLDKIRIDPEAWLASIEKHRRVNFIATAIELILVFIAALFIIAMALAPFSKSDEIYSKVEVNKLLEKQRYQVEQSIQHFAICDNENTKVTNPNSKLDCAKIAFPKETY